MKKYACLNLKGIQTTGIGLYHTGYLQIANNFGVLSDLLELYKIDVHETRNTDEYLTVLQVL